MMSMRLLALPLIGLLAACSHSGGGVDKSSTGRTAPAAALPQLVNGGFESGAAEPWELHTHADPAAYEVEVASEYARSGAFGMELRPIKDEPWGGMFQSVPVKGFEGRTARVTAWVRTFDASEATVLQIGLPVRLGFKEYLEAKMEPMVGDSGWRELSIEFTVPLDDIRVEVGLVHYGLGNFRIDDVGIEFP